ncbi:MAG: NTP transferase domain-containing protein [Fimbriimonadaceae bacterium]
MKWGAVIIAGGLVGDPLASALNTPRKALARIGDRSLIRRVEAAVIEAGISDCRIVSGIDLEPEITQCQLVMETDTKFESARRGVEALPPDVEAILFLPADTPFIRADDLRHFIKQTESRLETGDKKWYSAGLCELSRFVEMFPNVSAKPFSVKEGDFVTGALYATDRSAFYEGYELLEEVKRSRKAGLKLISKLGPLGVLRYFLRSLTLEQCAERFGRSIGGKLILVQGCSPETVAGVDTLRDWQELKRVAGDVLPPVPSDNL